MSRLLRNLFLVCAPIVLAGCQHPLAPSVAGQQSVGANHNLIYGGATAQAGALDMGAKASLQPQDQPLVASVQKQPECLTGQLADGLMLVFTTFTGH